MATTSLRRFSRFALAASVCATGLLVPMSAGAAPATVPEAGTAGAVASATAADVDGGRDIVGPGQGCAVDLLPEPMRARRALRVAETKFAEAAHRNDQPVAAMAAEARADGSLWLDRCGRAFYADPIEAHGHEHPVEQTEEQTGELAGDRDRSAASSSATEHADHAEHAEHAEAGTPGTAAAPSATDPGDPSQALNLESKPDANKTIYLDFLGGTVTGTAWNDSYGSTITVPPYSASAPVDTNFTTAELTEIARTWQVVSEDYAPFDVNVTTKFPGADRLERSSYADQTYGTRVMITAGGPIFTSCNCGGIAYLDVFSLTAPSHNYYQPAWVFTNGVGVAGKYIAEAASHEAGHNLGLDHDGTSSAGYYMGSDPWAPIMGASYVQPVSQWSSGEYADANNREDDLAVIASHLPRRTDDHGNTRAAATALAASSPADGVISTRSDVDAFAFTAAGSTTLTVTPAAGLPNLDIELTIVGDDGSTVAVTNPPVSRIGAGSAQGLGATWTATAPQTGVTWTALVDGVGSGTPSQAGKYSDYGSLGNYRITLTTNAVTPATPLSVTSTAPAAGVRGTAYSSTPVTGVGGTTPYTYTATGLPAGLTINAASGAITGTPTAVGSFAVTVTVTDAAGASVQSPVTINVSHPALVAPAQQYPVSAGTPFSVQLTAQGGDGTYTWTAADLPEGVSLSPSGGLVGTVDGANRFDFSATVTSAGQSVTAAISLQVNGGDTTDPVSVADRTFYGRIGSALPSRALVATGGSGTYVWTAVGLPAGLRLSADGVLSGTPRAAGQLRFTVTATSGDLSGSATVTLNIARSLLTFVTPNQLAPASAQRYYSTQVRTFGRYGAVMWTKHGTLPRGLRVAFASTGKATISGKPTQVGRFAFTLRAVDKSGKVTSKRFVLYVKR